jgi:hypothetical protein
MKLMYLLATFAVVLVMMASCTRQSVTGYTLQLMEFLTDPMYSYFL